jgi:exonuclease 1
MSRIELLQRHGVQPLMVFDGNAIEMKRAENSDRRNHRSLNLEKAMSALEKGDSSTARALFARAVSVTHEMAHQLIVKLREMNIPFLVAPFEADAQLAYLSRNGLCDVVITEDSDSLVFGCKRVLFKMDQVKKIHIYDVLKLDIGCCFHSTLFKISTVKTIR